MQPRPSESSSHSDNQNVSDPLNAPQHGFLPPHLHSADLCDPIDEVHLEFAGSSSNRDAVCSPTSNDASSHEQLRLRLENTANKPRPSFQLIDQHENALSPSTSLRQDEGPSFKIIKKKGSTVADGLHLEQFPNEVLTHILSHLPAASLSLVSCVSRRFYSLVTTPHAWRTAFSRFFPGQDAGTNFLSGIDRDSKPEAKEQLRSEKRLFTRLTALASWRSEYILRTRLLRSLGRGKPSQISPGHGASSRSSSAANNSNAVVTYSSQLFSTINNIHATWDHGKKTPRFIHGSDEAGSACTSDPNVGKVDNWGLSDPQALPQFADMFVGDEPYGLGDGLAGMPNSMDLSQPFGMIYGEGFPGGQAYYRSSDEMRGRFLSQPSDVVVYELGIPRIPRLTEAISAVWIAKASSITRMTDGLVGMLTGSTLGVVTAYSMGTDTAHARRIQRGQLSSKWVVSPGVPIIAIRVDDSYNDQRKALSRIWAVVLNALGEVYYLTDTPGSVLLDATHEDNDFPRLAWDSGRTVYWHLAEASRRIARDDPYHESEIPGSYSPRSSSKKMRLSQAQIIAETQEIEKFMAYPPAHFRKRCEGWDMRRRLEVDFSGDDGKGAGEGIFVIRCGFLEGENAEIRRYTRWRSEQSSRDEYPLPKTPPRTAYTTTLASLFGGGTIISPSRNASPTQGGSIFGGGSTIIAPARMSPPEPSTPSSPSVKSLPTVFIEEWRTSILSLKDERVAEITACAIDMSTYALLTVQEDPLTTVNGSSNFSSPYATPSEARSPFDLHIPGHRARFLAIGTSSGSVIMFNMRGPQPLNPSLTNDLHSVRTIHTDSPQISCLAVSALYVVHGGNDGLVQTWDPLVSSEQPVRTLNSRFSSRARRRLIQAEASVFGVGINLYAAGAIAIDPDPTLLRGMVSLGTHLRYWSYSSSAADQYQSKKRRLRRGERGSNGTSDRFTNTGRGALMDYISTEQEELKQDKIRRSREEARLRGRFGVDFGGMTEEEALQYAEMVSAEEFRKDEERRNSDNGYLGDTNDSSVAHSAWCSSGTATPEASSQGRVPRAGVNEEYDHDLEEAIRLSLLDGVDEGGRSPKESGRGEYGFSVTYPPKPKKGNRSGSTSPTVEVSKKNKKQFSISSQKANDVAVDDLEFALQLSLAEAQSKEGSTIDGTQNDGEDFPELESPAVPSKGKGKAGW